MSFGTVADATRNNEANRRLARGIQKRNFKGAWKEKKAQPTKQQHTAGPLQFGSHSETAKRLSKQRLHVLLFVLGLGSLSIAAILLLG